MVKNVPASAAATRDVGSFAGLGGSSGVGNGNLLQHSCLESSIARGAWWATSMELQSHIQLSIHTYEYSIRTTVAGI